MEINFEKGRNNSRNVKKYIKRSFISSKRNKETSLSLAIFLQCSCDLREINCFGQTIILENTTFITILQGLADIYK